MSISIDSNNVVTLGSSSVQYSEGVLTIGSGVTACNTFVGFIKMGCTQNSATSRTSPTLWDNRVFSCFSFTNNFTQARGYNCFGLLSNFTYPKTDGVQSPGVGSISYTYTSGFTSINAVNPIQVMDFYWGDGVTTDVALNSHTMNEYFAYDQFAADITYVWKVDSIPASKSVKATIGINYEGLNYSNMTDALTSSNTVWYDTSTITGLSAWKPGSELTNITPPPYFLFRVPETVNGCTYQLSAIKVQYWDYDPIA